MAFKIIYTEKALADSEAILDYILAANPAAASRFGNDLLNHVDLLAAFPHIGSSVKGRAGIRKILHTPVRIYYRIQEERRCVEILHFWHVARQEPEL